MEDQYRSQAKTFNTAKKYAEEILFPKMDSFQRYQRQADFGAPELEDSILLSEEIRDIQRFNGLKAMNDVLYNLLINISSTVEVNNSRVQVEQVAKLLNASKSMKEIFNNRKEMFFYSTYDGTKEIERLDRLTFERYKDTVDKMYINCEILMTKNKLLFAEVRDEFLTDEENLRNIKNEYVEG
jgi:hypothetical protein